MTRFFIPIILLFSIELYSSENKWSKLFSGNGFTFFIDLSSLEIRNETRNIKLLIDNKEPNTHGDSSSVIKREFQCKELMYRDWEKNFYKLNLGNGDKSRGSGKIEKPKWQYFPPGSAGGEMIKAICMLE